MNPARRVVRFTFDYRLKKKERSSLYVFLFNGRYSAKPGILDLFNPRVYEKSKSRNELSHVWTDLSVNRPISGGSSKIKLYNFDNGDTPAGDNSDVSLYNSVVNYRFAIKRHEVGTGARLLARLFLTRDRG